MDTAKSDTWSFHSGTTVSRRVAHFYHSSPLWTSWRSHPSRVTPMRAPQPLVSTCKYQAPRFVQYMIWKRHDLCTWRTNKPVSSERDMWTYFSLMLSVMGLILNYFLFSTYTFLSHTCICSWLSDLSLWSKLLYCVPALLGCPLDISNLTCPKRIFDFHSSRQFSIPVNAIIIQPHFLGPKT